MTIIEELRDRAFKNPVPHDGILMRRAAEEMAEEEKAHRETANKWVKAVESCAEALRQRDEAVRRLSEAERAGFEVSAELERERSRNANLVHEAEQITKRYAAYIDPEVHANVKAAYEDAENMAIAHGKALLSTSKELKASREYAGELEALLDEAEGAFRNLRLPVASLNIKIRLAAIREKHQMRDAPESEPLPEEEMCPNCVTPWKCNGPHIPTRTPKRDAP